MIKETKYIKSDGKVYEVIGTDGAGYPITKLTDLKEIPVEEKPKKSKKEE
jgi:hypothetical protein